MKRCALLWCCGFERGRWVGGSARSRCRCRCRRRRRNSVNANQGRARVFKVQGNKWCSQDKVSCGVLLIGKPGCLCSGRVRVDLSLCVFGGRSGEGTGTIYSCRASTSLPKAMCQVGMIMLLFYRHELQFQAWDKDRQYA